MLQERLVANSWYKSTVQELFYETCVIRGDKTAICFEGKEISYRELQNNVHKCAQALIMLGVKKGDHGFRASRRSGEAGNRRRNEHPGGGA